MKMKCNDCFDCDHCSLLDNSCDMEDLVIGLGGCMSDHVQGGSCDLFEPLTDLFCDTSDLYQFYV